MYQTKGKVRGLWPSIVRAVAASMTLMLVLAGVSAMLVSHEIIGEEWLDELSALILLLTGVVGTVCAGNQADGMAAGLIVLAICWSVLVFIGLILYSISLKGAAVTGLAIFGGTGASMLMHTGGGRRRSRKKYSYR